MRTKNFIFDIDGTLIDTFAMYMPALFATLADHGYHFTDVAAREKALYGISAVDAMRKLGIPEREIGPLCQDWIARAYQHFDQVTVLPGIPAALAQLAARPDTRLAIVTSKLSREYREYFQDQYRFARYFDVVVTADDTRQHKPDPAPLRLAIERLGADPRATVYVGDMLTDMQAAHGAGIKFAGALYGAVHPEQLAPADYRLTTPANLLTI